MKIVLKVENDLALVLWPNNNLPYVVCTLEHPNVKVGEQLTHWFHGTYFFTVDEALEYFNKRRGR